MKKNIVPLADTIEALREELRTARACAEKKGDLRFRVEDLELELQVVVRVDGKGKVGVSVLGADLGVDGGVARESIQKVRIRLGPEEPDGTRTQVAGHDDG